VDESDLNGIYNDFEEECCEAENGSKPDMPLRMHRNASEITESYKRVMLNHISDSVDHDDGAWREKLQRWKRMEVDAIKKEKGQGHPDSLASQAKALGVREDVSLEEFAKVLVIINESHFGYTAQFVGYDTDFYNYLKGGAIKFKASDWYDYLDSQG
jgi:hypothetical protein